MVGKAHPTWLSTFSLDPARDPELVEGRFSTLSVIHVLVAAARFIVLLLGFFGDDTVGGQQHAGDAAAASLKVHVNGEPLTMRRDGNRYTGRMFVPAATQVGTFWLIDISRLSPRM